MAIIYLKRKPETNLCEGCYFDNGIKCTKIERLSPEQYSKEDACGDNIYVVAKREVSHG